MKRKALVTSLGSAALLIVTGCESGDSNASWSNFARCMVGDGVTEASQVAGRIREIELAERKPPAEWDDKQGWPGRCSPHADALYTSLGSSSDTKLFRRALTAQLGCKDEDPPGCHFDPNGAILPAAAELWEHAQRAGIKYDGNAQVPVPNHDLKLSSPESWQPLAKDAELADTFVTPSGTLRVLLKSRSAPLTVCDVAGPTAKCQQTAAEFPKLAHQSVALLKDEQAVITGLTAEGRQAFTLGGEAVDFRGTVESATRHGVAIEDVADGQGFLAVLMQQGKKKGEATFAPTLAGKAEPVGVDAFASWTEPKDSTTRWHFGSVAGKSLKEVSRFDGDFPGFLHPCTTQNGASLGVWGRAEGQREAVAGPGNTTPVAVSFLAEGRWSKPVTGKLPFKRSVTTDRCSPQRRDISWAAADGPKLSVGQLSCTPKGCEESTSSFDSFELKRWLTVGSTGKELVAVWTTALGDTRMRVGDPKNFAAAKETVLFEGADRGGPVFSKAQTFITPHGIFLLVLDKGPTVLVVDERGIVPVKI